MNMGCSVKPTKKGFLFWNHFDRSYFTNYFEYNPELKKLQLVKIEREEYDLGTVGDSELNLVNCEYVGNFKYAKDYKYGKDNKYQQLPTINTSLEFPTVFLESFDDYVNYDFEEKCVDLMKKAIENAK